MSKILDEFIKRTELTHEDRERLREKRGFKDELISRSLFRSARPENEKVILDLLKEYGQNACKEAGLVVIKHGKAEPTYKLLGVDKLGNRQPNILIPYFEEGTCVGLRPHKNFVKGMKLNVYYASDEYDEDATTVMAEGEFKAKAATAYGYQAFAVPGISSFVGDKQAGRKFVAFYEDLVLAGIRDVVVVFDNEDKGNPDLDSYKEDPTKRYDVQYYAYLMASKLNEYGADIEASIAWIPDEHRDSEGKADIDGMLAAGVTEEAFDVVVDSALEPEEFLDTLPEEARDVIAAKLARRQERISFVVRNGCYFVPVVNPKDGTTEEVQASNFTMKYIATHLMPEGDFNYEFEITNDEKQTAVVQFDGSDFADYRKFRKTLSSYGRFLWMSTGRNLDALFLEVLPNDMKIVHRRDKIGWDEELDVFFFDNCALDSSGEIVKYSKDGDVKLGDKFYRVIPSETRQIVHFPLGSSGKNWEIGGLVDIAAKLTKNYGSLGMYDVCSWFVAAVYKPWLFPINRTFPLLGVFGKKNSGKSRLMQWLLSIFYESPKAISFDSSTKPGLRNQTTTFQYLPVWLDEFRNDQKGKSYLDMLRGIYDHNQVIISSNTPGQNRVFKLRSSLILSGEHIPADETGALNQRMVTVQLHDRPEGSEFGWFETNFSTFGGILSFLLRKREKYVSIIRNEYFHLLERYRKFSHVEQRVAINYALINAISSKLLGADKDYLEAHLQEVFGDIYEDDLELDPISQMLEVCMRYYKARGTISNVEYAITVKHKSGEKHKAAVYFSLKSCLDFYNEVLRRQGKTPHHQAQIRRSLKDHPWTSDKLKNVRIKGSQVKCYEVNLDKAPSSIIHCAFNLADDGIRNILMSTYGGEDGVLEMDDLEQYEMEDFSEPI